MSWLRISGRVYVIDGTVDTDTIIKSRYCTTTDAETLAPYCLEELAQEPPFAATGPYLIVIATGTFGIGSARIQAPAALQGANVKAVLAPAFAPIFFENCLNGAFLLPLRARLDVLPATEARAALEIADSTFHLTWPDGNVKGPVDLPAWALAGRSWLDLIEAEATGAGGLDNLRRRGLGTDF